MTTHMRVIPPPANDLYAPKGRRGVPMPEDLAEHRPIVPYGEGSGFDGQFDMVDRARRRRLSAIRCATSRWRSRLSPMSRRARSRWRCARQ
jgi:hypothetical protein